MKISKADRAQLAQHIATLKEARRNVEFRFVALTNDLAGYEVSVNKAIEAYNKLLFKAAEFVERVAGELREEYDEKSERWQEGEAGQAALAFVEDWEGLNLQPAERVRILLPDQPTLKDEDLAVLPEEDQ